VNRSCARAKICLPGRRSKLPAFSELIAPHSSPGPQIRGPSSPTLSWFWWATYRRFLCRFTRSFSSHSEALAIGGHGSAIPNPNLISQCYSLALQPCRYTVASIAIIGIWGSKRVMGDKGGNRRLKIKCYAPMTSWA